MKNTACAYSRGTESLLQPDDGVDLKARASHGFSAFNAGLHNMSPGTQIGVERKQDEFLSRLERTGLIVRYHPIAPDPSAEAATGKLG